jgi:hypothetical protein
MLIYEAPLHNVKYGVWCALSAIKITGPIFFVSSNYTNMLHMLQQHLITCPIKRYYLRFTGAQCNTKHSQQFSVISPKFLTPFF